MRDRRWTGIAVVGVVIIIVGYVWDLLWGRPDANIGAGLLIIVGTAVGAVGLAGVVLDAVRRR